MSEAALIEKNAPTLSPALDDSSAKPLPAPLCWLIWASISGSLWVGVFALIAR